MKMNGKMVCIETSSWATVFDLYAWHRRVSSFLSFFPFSAVNPTSYQYKAYLTVCSSSHTVSLASFHSHHSATHFHLLLRKWCGFIKKSICLPLKSPLNPFPIDRGIQTFSNRLFDKPREFHYMKEKQKKTSLSAPILFASK